MKKPVSTIVLALLFTAIILSVGYMSFGIWPTLIFTSGFLGGYILWLLIPTNASFASIKVIYIVVFVLFLLHRVEERVSGFFPALADITQVQTPEIISWPVILLVVTSVGAWLLIPYLMKRESQFGYYLAWTFFAAMGVTELAHFIFPFFQGGSYGYFPGMASVFLLAPAAWWGMWRLSQKVPTLA